MLPSPAAPVNTDLYQDILQQLPLSCLLVKTDGTIQESNQMFSLMSGFSQDELRSHSVYDFGDYLDSSKARSIFSQAVKDGYASERMRMVNRSGIVFQAEVRVSTLQTEGGLLLLVMLYNTSQEYAYEQELRLNNSIFLELIDNSHRALFIEDTQGIIRYINHKLLRFLHVTMEPEQLVGQPGHIIHQIMHDTSVDPFRYQQYLDQSVGVGKGIVDVDIEMQNGTIFRLAYEPVMHDGQLGAHLWFFNDITLEVATKREVENQKYFYDQVIQEMPLESIILSTENLKLLHINDEAIKNQSLNGWQRGETLEAFMLGQSRTLQRALAEKAERFRTCIEQRTPQQYDDIFTDESGTQHDYKRFITPYFRGEELYLISEFSVNLTDFKLVEQALIDTHNHLLSLIESSKAQIWSVDRNKHFLYSNKSFYDVLNKDFNIKLHKGYYMPDSFPDPRLRAEWDSYYDRVLAGETFSVTRTFPLPFEGFTMEYTFKPIMDAEGTITGASVFGYDLSELTSVQNKLQAISSNLRSLIDTDRAMIWSVDKELRLIYANSHFNQVRTAHAGFPVKEGDQVLMGISDTGIVQFWTSQYERALQGETFVLPAIRLSDGSIYEFSFKPIYDHENLLIGASVIAFDITHIKKVNELLEASESNLHALVSSLDDIVFELDLNNQFTNIWTGKESLLALPKDQMLHKRLSDIGSGIDTDIFQSLIHKAKTNLTTHYHEYVLNGVSYQAKISPIIQNGTVTGVSMLAKDITDKIIQDKRLKASEARYRLITEQMTDMVIMVNLDGRILYISPSCWQLLGYTPQELIGTDAFAFVPEEEKQRARELLLITKDEFPTGMVEFRLIRKDGSMVHTESRLKLVKEDPDNPFVQVVTRDISERKAAEESKRKSAQKEKDLIDIKSRLVSTVSHEFKTPMSTIRSSAELIDMYLKKDPLKFTPKMEAHVQMITGEIDRINTLMNDVFILMKEDAAKKEPVLVSVDIAELCKKIIQTNFSQPDLQSLIRLKTGKDHYHVLGDPVQLNYSIFNLLNNALKYSLKQEPVELGIRLKDNQVVITVKDTGIGIPEKDLPYLFTSFFRASNTDKIPGTGLGLVIVKTFIERNKGTISIDSIEHKGTTATIRLPYAAPQTKSTENRKS